MFIFKQKWYRRLIRKDGCKTKALFEDHERCMMQNKLLVCFVPGHSYGLKYTVKPDGSPCRFFSLFENYACFYKYAQHFPLEERTFFEIILGEFPQKPHFDVDISKEDFDNNFENMDMKDCGNQLLESLITVCRNIFEDWQIELDLSKDILIYSSHGESKISFHLVINNYCHNNHLEAKAFYDLAMLKLNSPYKIFVDQAPYSKIQQFRIVGCQKWKSHRPKMYNEYFFYQGEEYQHIYNEKCNDEDLLKKNLVIIYESLVSFISGCRYLPSLESARRKENLTSLPEIEADRIEICIKMMQDKMKSCPFVFDSSQDGFIMLRRTAPSLCPLCNRIHEHENPWIVILGERVYWNCRRNNAQKYYLGNIGSSKIEEKIELEEPVNEKPVFSFGNYGAKKIEILESPKRILNGLVAPNIKTRKSKLPSRVEAAMNCAKNLKYSKTVLDV